jgi:osmotically inducible protein OsmC
MIKEAEKMKAVYTTQVTNTGGRNGRSYVPDGSFSVDVAKPKEMGGDATNATNPEQLFAAAYSACFNGALQLVLERARVKYESSKVTAIVSLVEEPIDKGLKLSARIQAAIDGVDKETAEKYVKLAHNICPYSKAVKGNVEVEIEVL